MQDQMRTCPQTLSSLRNEIDRIDDALLDLVEARLLAARGIAVMKNAGGDACLKLRPRREAQVVERLTARSPGVDPALIGQLWNTLMAFSLQGQARLELVLHGGGDRLPLQDAARARFGLAASLRWAQSEDEAVSAACAGECVAVIARGTAPALADGRLVVFDTLSAGGETAYAIGRIAPEDLA